MANVTWLDDEPEEDFDNDEKIKGRYLLNLEGDCLYIKAQGPYGHLKVFSTRGPVPKQLANQVWTDPNMARNAVEYYVKANVSSTKMKPKGEPAKIKSEAATKAKETRVANKQEEVVTNGEADDNGPSISI